MGDKMAWPKGKPRSKETKEKIGKASKELWENKEHREKVTLAIQEQWDSNPEQKAKFSERFSGEGNPMFGRKQPHLSELNKSRQGKTLEEIHGEDTARQMRKKFEGRTPWNRQEPRCRDSYGEEARKLVVNQGRKQECELCGALWNLDVHHKDGNFRNNDISNLQVLCRGHHMKTDQRFKGRWIGDKNPNWKGGKSKGGLNYGT